MSTSVTWPFAQDLADAMHATKRYINKRATEEHWKYRTQTGRGGTRKKYNPFALPADVQAAYYESIGVDANAAQAQYKLADVPVKAVTLKNHNCRSAVSSPLYKMEAATEAARKIAYAREKIVLAFDENPNIEQFLLDYNGGKVAAEARETLGGKHVGRATLRNWTAKYQAGGVASLLPQYKKGDGSGASFNQHTRDLIWMLYLNLKKPTVADVLR
jgi:hypothetical protein